MLSLIHIYAVLGFTGKAFGKVAFNLSINAAASGGALLQQAWFDVQLKKQFAIRGGKFKTCLLYTSGEWKTDSALGITIYYSDVECERYNRRFLVAFDADGALNTIRLVPAPAASTCLLYTSRPFEACFTPTFVSAKYKV